MNRKRIAVFSVSLLALAVTARAGDAGADWPRRIPPESFEEVNRELQGAGWRGGDLETNGVVIYWLVHTDGTHWWSQFAHRFFDQVKRIKDPRWLPIENYDTDALVLEKRPELEKAGWHAVYSFAPYGPGRLLLSYSVCRSMFRCRNTDFESEFRYWLLHGPESCWGADRPSPNCGVPQSATVLEPVTVRPDQIFER